MGAVAITVPVISGWISQKYVNVPGVVKVCDQLVAFFTRPLANDWSSAVTVWVTVSVFDQVTVLPAVMVIVDGENRLLAMFTDTLLGAVGAPGAAGGVAAGGLTAGGSVAGGAAGGVVAGGMLAGGGVGAPPAPVTITVPRMLPWKSHPYAYVPAAVNVCTNDAPALSDPLSNDALSAVTVCFDPSSFTHVTVAPTATVTVAGANLAPARCTEAVSGAGGAATGGGGVPGPGGTVAGGAVSLTTMVPR